MKLKLKRPLVFFDIESTGLNRKEDRIIELAIVKLHPNGKRDERVFLLNPGIPIPKEASDIHGILDEQIKDCPVFKDKGEEILKEFEGCDISGYNLLAFDIPMLENECKRADIKFDPDQYKVVDVQRIFHKKEPRDLTAALRFYCDRELEGAHGALADTRATMDVLLGQLERYDDVPVNVEALHKYCDPRRSDWVDRAGRLRTNNNGDICIGFGQKQGQRLVDLAKNDAGYLKWILRGDFPDDMQKIVKEALDKAADEKKQKPRGGPSMGDAFGGALDNLKL